MRKPESKFEAGNFDGVKLIYQQDPKAKRHQKPNGKTNKNQSDIGSPIGFMIRFIAHRGPQKKKKIISQPGFTLVRV